jgi:multiple RNA-binding domain-containing protein 1
MEVMQPKAKTVSQVHNVSPPENDQSLPTQVASLDPPEEAQQDVTDMEWMRQRMKGGLGDTDSLDKVFEQSDTEEQDQEGSSEKGPTEEMILRTARLFVRNLTFTCTAEELRPLFEPFGTISQVRRIYL